MPFPMQTGYQRQDPNQDPNQAAQLNPMDPMDAPQDPNGPVPSTPSPDAPGAPMPQAGGRTGADVIAAALAQPTLRTGDPKAQQVGTTGVQGEMDYGSDPGYGA